MTELHSYRVLVQTGDVDDAGTNANVYITLYGALGSTDEVQLDNGRDNFEQAAAETFAVSASRDLGELKQVRIRHDNTGERPGWFLDQIRVRDELTDQEWVFPCSRWLARDEDDGQIDRTLDLA